VSEKVTLATTVLPYCEFCQQRDADEHWTGLGLDWIRTIANFVELGLDQDFKSLQNLGSGPELD